MAGDNNYYVLVWNEINGTSPPPITFILLCDSHGLNQVGDLSGRENNHVNVFSARQSR